MTWTATLILISVCIAGIYDLYADLTGGVQSTISKMLQSCGIKSPGIVFAIGFICGHIFGYMSPN